MNKQWRKCTLGDVLLDLKNGLNCKQDKSGLGDRISRIESVADGLFNESRVGFAHLSETQKERYRLRPGDILFSHINSPPHVGKVAYFDSSEPIYHGVNLLLMRPSEQVDPRYLFYFLVNLRACGYWEKNCKKSVNQASVNQKDIRKVPFGYPICIHEQRRIVAVLDEAFAGIATATANVEKNMANVRELFDSTAEAVFTELLECTPDQMPLETLAEGGSRLTYGVVKPGPEGEIPFVRGGDISNGRVAIDKLRTITQETSDQYRRTLLKGGELLICLVGMPGQCAIASSDLAGANIARQVGLIRLTDAVIPEFVKDYLLSPAGQKSLGTHTGGSVQQVINLGDLKKVCIPVPEKSRQAIIVRQMDDLRKKCQKLEAATAQRLAALAELKASILRQAFSGYLSSLEKAVAA